MPETRRALRIAALVLGTCLASVPAASQGVTSPYLDLVWRYRAGDHAGAVAAAMALPTPGLRARVAEDTGPLLCRTLDLKVTAMCLALAVPDGAHRRLVALWRTLLPAALLLHVEVHARLDDPTRVVARRVHEDIVVDLLVRLRELAAGRDGPLVPELRPWMEDGARLLLWSLQLDRDIETTRNLIDRPLRAWTVLGDVQLAAGWVEELSADDAAVRDAYRRLSRRDVASGRLNWMERQRRARLTDAAAAYRLAIEAGSGAEARLRLGRVLMQRAAIPGPADAGAMLGEAEVELRKSLAAGPEPRFAYLAELFLAGVLEARGARGAAREAYERARRHWPDAQAARVGLVRRLALDGEPDAARALAEEGPAAAVATVGRSRRSLTALDEPWFWYDYGQGWRFGPALERLRATLK